MYARFVTIPASDQGDPVVEYIEGGPLDEMWDDELWPRDIGDLWQPALDAFRLGR